MRLKLTCEAGSDGENFFLKVEDQIVGVIANRAVADVITSLVHGYNTNAQFVEKLNERV